MRGCGTLGIRPSISLLGRERGTASQKIVNNMTAHSSYLSARLLIIAAATSLDSRDFRSIARPSTEILLTI
jgi:hypothetical protein